MSLERIVGIHIIKQQNCWGILWVEPAGKEGNQQHDIWCLIKIIWANRVAIFDSVIRYLTLAKLGQSTFALQPYSCAIASNSTSSFVAGSLFVILSVVIHCSVLIVDRSALFKFVLFSVCSVLCCYFCSDNLIFNYRVSFFSWYWKCFNPHYNNHLASQQRSQHKTCTCTQYWKWEPITILDIRGIPWINFSLWGRRGGDNSKLLLIYFLALHLPYRTLLFSYYLLYKDSLSIRAESKLFWHKLQLFGP